MNNLHRMRKGRRYARSAVSPLRCPSALVALSLRGGCLNPTPQTFYWDFGFWCSGGEAQLNQMSPKSSGRERKPLCSSAADYRHQTFELEVSRERDPQSDAASFSNLDQRHEQMSCHSTHEQQWGVLLQGQTKKKHEDKIWVASFITFHANKIFVVENFKIHTIQIHWNWDNDESENDKE